MAQRAARRGGGAAAACLLLAALAGCDASPALLQPSPSLLQVQAREDQPAPVAFVRVDVSDELKLQVAASRVGVAAVKLEDLSLHTVEVEVDFRPPTALGPGLYLDRLTFQLCPDAACRSPRVTRVVPVRYEVLPASQADAATLVLDSLTPAWVRAGVGGDAGLTLLVLGGGFGLDPVVRLDGQPRPTSVRSASLLAATLAAEDLAVTRTASVTVARSGDGGLVSNPLPFRVFGPGAAPLFTSLTPSEVDEDGPDLALRAVGQGVERPGRLELDGVPLPTMLESDDVVSALAPSALLTVGTHQVVLRGAPGDAGPASDPLPLLVRPLPALGLSRLVPDQVPVGSLPFTLRVLGSGFGQSARAVLDGGPLRTTVLSSSELSAEVPAEAVARARVVAVEVASRAGTTAPRDLTVVRTPQDAVTVAVDSAHTGVAHVDGFALPAGPRWQVDLGGVPSYPLVAEGLVVVTVDAADGGALVALDQGTGAVRWGPVALPGPASPAYQDGLVLVLTGRPASGQLELRAYQADAGTMRWLMPLGPWTAQPPGLTAALGLVLPGLRPAGFNQPLYRADTGALLGSRNAFGISSRVGTAPAVTPGGLQVYLDGCQAQAFQGTSVAPSWGVVTGSCTPAPSVAPWPVLAGGLLYAASGADDGGGGVLDATTGRRLDTFPASASPAVDTTRLYLTTPGGSLEAYPLPRAGQGALWRFTPDAGLVTAPLAVNTTVFVAGGTRLHAVDALTGLPRWSAELPAPVSPPHDGGLFAPLTAPGVGHGLLVVPAGTTLTAFTLSDDP